MPWLGFRDEDRSVADPAVNGLRKVLDSPVVLSSLAEDMRTKVEEDHGIWVKKKGATTVSQVCR